MNGWRVDGDRRRGIRLSSRRFSRMDGDVRPRNMEPRPPWSVRAERHPAFCLHQTVWSTHHLQQVTLPKISLNLQISWSHGRHLVKATPPSYVSLHLYDFLRYFVSGL